MAEPKPLIIDDQSGGINQYDAPTSIPLDQCMEAENVEFVTSMLGERRKGSSTVTISGSGLESRTHLSWLYRHLPTADQTIAELWAFSVTAGTGSRLARKTTSWSTVTPVDTIGIAGVEGFQLQGVTIHNKLFIAHKSAVDRLHVSDGTASTALRRTGLATPSAAPTGANTGAGTFNGTRYYRIRYTVQSGGTTLRRSEPSAVLTHAPSGAGTGVIVTKPVTISESETHWELEASVNNADFYRIATTVVGTATVTDSQPYGSGYAAIGTLSSTAGDYTVPHSCKFLAVDNDRLLLGGSWEQAALGSRVSWTVVFGDTTGVGNDERIPIDSDNFVDLDTYDGGELTGLSGPVNGYVYAFKYGHIYRGLRTKNRAAAYSFFPLTKTLGALPGSLVDGVDGQGRPCLYFLDPKTGPWCLSQSGLLSCGLDIDTTWKTVNQDATTVVCRGLYYPHNRQVKWFLSVDSDNTPTLQINLQTNNTVVDVTGVRKGWSTATGIVGQAISACLFADNIEAGAARTLTLVPFIGLGGSAGSIRMLDTGTSDSGTVYRAHVTTRPFMPATILDKFAVMSGALLATAAAGIEVFIKAIRNFGTHDMVVSTQLDPVYTEDYVIKPLDNLSFAELTAMQLEYGDDMTEVALPQGRWELHQIAFRPSAEDVT